MAESSGWGEAVFGNPLQEVVKLEQLKQVGIQNRLNQMAMDEKVADVQVRNRLARVLTEGNVQQTAVPQAPVTPSQAGEYIPSFAEKPAEVRPEPQTIETRKPLSRIEAIGKMMEDPNLQSNPRAFDAVQRLYDKEIDRDISRIEKVSKIAKSLGPERFKQLLPILQKSGILQGMDPDKIVTGDIEVLYDPITKEKIGYARGDKVHWSSGNITVGNLAQQLAKEKLLAKGITRPPTAAETSEAWAEVEGRKTGAGTFDKMSADQQQIYYQDYLNSRKVPPFANRDIQSRNAFMAGFAKWATGKGLSGSDVATMKSEYGALEKSANFQQKNLNMMSSYINNIDKQIDKVIGKNGWIDKLTRTDATLVNIPIRQWLTRVKGTANENIITAYVTEISNEITRLSMANAQSIAALPEGAREHWEKIHDLNMPVGELKTLLQEGKVMGQLRVDSVKEELGATRELMKKIGGSKGGGEPAAIRNNNPLNIKFSPTTKKFGAQEGSTALDGGSFAKFETQEEGMKAAKNLLFNTNIYRNNTVDQAMKKWSNSGYTGSIAPELKNKKMFQLSGTERDQLVSAMLKAEGTLVPSTAQRKTTTSTAATKKTLPPGWDKEKWMFEAKIKNPTRSEAQLNTLFTEMYGGL